MTKIIIDGTPEKVNLRMAGNTIEAMQMLCIALAKIAKDAKKPGAENADEELIDLLKYYMNREPDAVIDVNELKKQKDETNKK